MKSSVDTSPIALHRFWTTHPGSHAGGALMRQWEAVPAVDPESSGDHPLPQRLDTKLHPTACREVFRRQRRTKVGMVLATKLKTVL